MSHVEIETLEALAAQLACPGNLVGVVLQDLDLFGYADRLSGLHLEDTVFLGCQMPPQLLEDVVAAGAMVFPSIEGLPYKLYRNRLYTPEDLLGDYEVGQAGAFERSLDGRIYRHYIDTGKAEPPSILETLARSLHDHAVTDVKMEFIEGKTLVAIMGGHSMPRSAGDYLKVARMGRALARSGFLVTTGGGPGAMEAGHLGAWMSQREESDLARAVEILSDAPIYDPIGPWLDTAFEVKDTFPQFEGEDPPESLGVPTWYYGHEPPAIFPSHIAKYFANSIREEGLVTIAEGGIIFTPGSAGTIQEVFQDTTQNHYNTSGVISPMIFLGKKYWTEDLPVIPLLRKLAGERAYAEKIFVTDDEDEVVEILRQNS